MSCQILSAGYTGSRLCRTGTAALAEITNIPPDIIYYSCGWKFNIFYTATHQWYGCGDNQFNQMGFSCADTDTFQLLSHLNTIIPTHFSCGDKFTAIVSEDGSLYTMGNEYGRVPTKKQLPHRISFVVCGTESIIAIPDGPGIYFCERGKSEMKYECKNVTFVDAAAGAAHMLALSSDGRVFSWGKGSPCGQGAKFNSQIPKPVNIDGNPTIARVFAFNKTSFLLDSDNNLWAAGANKRGQAGLGPQIKSKNTFVKVPTFTDSVITEVAVGDTMSYVLTEQGEVFSTGDGDDSRLMQDNIDSLTAFTRCSLLKKKRVSFISAGCSHVIVAIGMRSIIPHPILGMNAAASSHPKVFETIGKNFAVDVSDASFALLGFERGDIIQTDDGQQHIIEGITYANEIALRNTKTKEIIVVNEKDISMYHRLFKLISRQNCTLQTQMGRSGIHYTFDTTPTKCLQFGFLSGERVSHEMFGLGTVLGVLGGAIWFSWDHDTNEASRSEDNDPEFIHKHLHIVESPRTIVRMPVDGTIVNVETAPCDLLKDYNIQVNDLVTDGENIYYVIGSFTHFCVLQNILTGYYTTMVPSSVEVCRRESEKPILIQVLTLSETVEDCDISYKPNNQENQLFPYDRIITKRGFATVIGKYPHSDNNENNSKYWLRYDDVYVLNGGLVLSDISAQDFKYMLIRRIGCEHIDKDGFTVSGSIFEEENLNPGDVCLIDDIEFVVLGKKQENNIYKLLNTSTKQITQQEVNNYTIIYRAGFDYKRVDKTLRNLECQFSVGLENFAGHRMKPGDRVETPEGIATVVGMLAGDVWFKHDHDSGSVCFSPQAVFSSNLKVIKRLGSDLL